MNKDEFIRDFLAFNFSPDEIPVEWMGEAWEIEEIRDYLIDDMARMISKVGEIYYAPDFQIMLSKSLSCEQVVRLYIAIRDGSHRHEDDWRSGFQMLFQECAHALPSQLVDPYNDWYLRGRNYPVEWMESAWSSDDIRTQVVSSMSYDINSGGEAWCGSEWLELLDRSLSRDQIVRLFMDLRNSVTRPESEWRSVFEQAFSDCANHLPVPLKEGERRGDAS